MFSCMSRPAYCVSSLKCQMGLSCSSWIILKGQLRCLYFRLRVMLPSFSYFGGHSLSIMMLHWEVCLIWTNFNGSKSLRHDWGGEGCHVYTECAKDAKEHSKWCVKELFWALTCERANCNFTRPKSRLLPTACQPCCQQICNTAEQVPDNLNRTI